MEFTADSLRLDILELARTGNKLLSVAGRPDWMCQAVEVADPITFTTPDTVLVSHAFFLFDLGDLFLCVHTFFFVFLLPSPLNAIATAQNLFQHRDLYNNEATPYE